MAGLRHSIEAEVLGLLASLCAFALLSAGQIILCPAFPIRGFFLQHVRENVRQCVGGGCRRFRWPQFAAHAARKRAEIAGARAETLGRHAQGATGPILDPPTARGEHFAPTKLVIGTEAEPGGNMLVRRPWMHIEAHLGTDEVDRWSLEPRHLREVDAGDPVQMGAESTSRCVALGVPMGGRRWGERGLVGIDLGIQGSEDACDFLIAGRDVLLGKVRECEGWCEREDLCGAVIPLQRFGNGVGTGLNTRVPIRGEGTRGALPSDYRAANAHACHPGKITHAMVQVEMHLLQRLLPRRHMLHGHPDPIVPMAEQTAEVAHVLRRPKRRCQQAIRLQLLEPATSEAIRFRTPRHIVDMARLDEGHLKASGLQNLQEREPVYPGGCHHDGRHPTGRSPVGEPMQVAGKRAKLLDGLGIAIGGDTDPMLFRPHSDASGMRMDDEHSVGHGLGLLAFFGHTFLQSGAERGEEGETGSLLHKDRIGGRAAQRREAVSS